MLGEWRRRTVLGMDKVTKSFIVGALTPPVVVGGAYAVLRTGEYVYDTARKVRRGQFRLRDDRARRLNAAAIMYAPEFFAMDVPGGIVLAWRSKVRWTAPVYRLSMAMTRLKRELNEGVY